MGSEILPTTLNVTQWTGVQWGVMIWGVVWVALLIWMGRLVWQGRGNRNAPGGWDKRD